MTKKFEDIITINNKIFFQIITPIEAYIMLMKLAYSKSPFHES